MGLLKVPEFAEKYGLNRTNVYTYKKRGKLKILDEGYIDEDDPINKIFIDSRETSSKVKTKPSEKEHITKVPKPKQDETPQQSKRISRAISDPLYLEFQQTNKLRDEKLQEEIRQARLRNDIAEKRVVKIETVEFLITELFNQFRLNVYQQGEQLIRDSLNEVQSDNVLITKSCSKFTDIINNSYTLSIKEVDKLMKLKFDK